MRDCRWWVEGTPLSDEPGLINALPFFEVMTSNVWLPEDMTAAIALYSSEPGPAGAPGLWGTPLGSELRTWMARHGRPLLWADGADTPMLLDPLVATQLQTVRFSHSRNVSAADLLLFETAWAAPAWQNGSFGRLAGQASPHLHFNWQDWTRRHACEPAERASAANVVMGTDGHGRCVYWSPPPPLPPPQKTERKTAAAVSSWECLNDGTCLRSNSHSHAAFSSEASCLAQCAHSWVCTRKRMNVSRASGSAYCIPKLRGNTSSSSYSSSSMLMATTMESTGQYVTMAACEADCTIDDSDRSDLCHDWEMIAITTLLLIFTFYMVGFCASIWVLAPKQKQFHSPLFRGFLCCFCNKSGLGPRATVVERRCFMPVPWWDCLFYTCCPCFQCIRVLGFLLGRKFGLFLCGIFICCFPCSIPLYCGANFLFGCVFSTCIRYKIRQRLGIEGTLCEDVAIHCFARGCAQCQEARELKVKHRGFFYSEMMSEEHVVAPLNVGPSGGRNSQAGTELGTPLLDAAAGTDAREGDRVRRVPQRGSELVISPVVQTVGDGDDGNDDDEADNRVMEEAVVPRGGLGVINDAMAR